MSGVGTSGGRRAEHSGPRSGGSDGPTAVDLHGTYKEYMYMYYRSGNAMTKAADALVEWGGAKLQN